MATTTKTIGCGDIEATELIFTRGQTFDEAGHVFVLQADRSENAYLETLSRYPKHTVEMTTDYYIEDTTGKWFVFFNVDCFAPPAAIIRARSFEDAYETFTEEFSDWIKVDDVDAKDYPEDERDYNGNGVHIDASNVQGYELRLTRINL